VKMIPYDGNDAWVEPVLLENRDRLDAPAPPPPGDGCEHCVFAQKAAKA